MAEYKYRVIEQFIRDELEAVGAVLITGPKLCGKTTTAEKIAASSFYLHTSNDIDLAKYDTPRILEGDNPRLIDEWQVVPEIWDAVRFAVDKRQEDNLFILTGSVAVDESKINHSGLGRISRVVMRPMSLFESGDSTGEVSLASMFVKDIKIKGNSNHNNEDIANLIIRGGSPKIVTRSKDKWQRQVMSYCENLVTAEFNRESKIRMKEDFAKALMRALSRHISTSATMRTIQNDLEINYNFHIDTIYKYISEFKKLYIVEDLEAWSPKLRSKTTIRTSDTHHFIDPSIAAYYLGASANDLLYDPNTFGLLFESMVIRDLRVYSQVINGKVYHYRDKNGLEADAIIHLSNGDWGAIEVKLSPKQADAAAKSLLKIKELVVKEPKFLMVITATGYAYTREDGVHVVPIGCLRN